MKIIFSRKGFDSTAGGNPSLIFPDGSLFSIPIPGSKGKNFYKDLDFSYQGNTIQEILNDVTSKKISSPRRIFCDYSKKEQCCHLDPMFIDNDQFKGIAFGQANGAEGHLRKQKISEGDIFLFYGWYRKVAKHDGVWSYDKTSPDIHLIWSYMKVGNMALLDTNKDQINSLLNFPFLSLHPHIGEQGNGKNQIYCSNEYKYFLYDEKRCLTDLKRYEGRSTWRLPSCFNQKDAFSFLNNFTKELNHTVIRYQGYGQEFVLDLDKVGNKKDQTAIIKEIERYIT